MNFIIWYISSIWLFLDIIWWVFIFYFWIPNEINKDWLVGLCLEQEDENMKNKAEKYDLLSKIWLTLLVLWFIFQFIWSLQK